MVEPLERRLAPRAERALVHGVVGVSLELHDAALAVLRDDAAAGRTLATHGREPRGDARHDLLVRHDQGQDGLRRPLAAAGGGRGAARRDDPEEVSSVHHLSELQLASGRGGRVTGPSGSVRASGRGGRVTGTSGSVRSSGRGGRVTGTSGSVRSRVRVRGTPDSALLNGGT